jgi:hypothetical protein
MKNKLKKLAQLSASYKKMLLLKLEKLKAIFNNIYLKVLSYKFRLKQQIRYSLSSPSFKAKAFVLIGGYTLLSTILYVFFGSKIVFSLDSGGALTFFLGIAAMIAGMVALVFSFSQFLLSNASEKLPSNFYEFSARDGFHNFVFFITGVFVMFFVMSSVLFGKLRWGLSDESIMFSFYLIGLVFILLYLLYERTIELTDPKKVLVNVIKKNTFKSVNQVAMDVKEITSVLSKLPDGKKASKAATTATAFNSPLIQQELGEIQKNLNYLFDYHGRLVENSEFASAGEVLDIIVELLSTYLDQRKNSSVMIPTGLMLVGQSDSHSFLASSLERILSIAESYMTRNDKAGIAKIVNVVINLCQKAVEVKFIANRLGDNPIFEQFRGYLDLMTASAIRLKNEEAMFQLILAYPKLSGLAVQYSYKHEFGHIYGSLDKLFMASLGKEVELQEVLLGQIIESYTTILKQLVLGEYWLLEQELDDIFNHIVEVLHYTSLVVKMKNDGLRGAYFTQTSLTGPFEMARGLIFTLYQKAKKTKKKEDQRKIQHQLLLVADETRSALRSLSEKLKDPNNLLVLSLSQVIQDITILLIDLLDDGEWNEHKRDLEAKIRWYLHQIEWFTADVRQFELDQSFDGLVNALAQIGMKSIDKGKFDIAKDAMDLLVKFAFEALERGSKKGSGFDEPRVMEVAFYIAILLRKHGQVDFIPAFKASVEKFREEYKKKWWSNLPPGFKPSSREEDQLLQELLKLLSNRERYSYGDRLFADEFPEQRFMQMVTSEDIKLVIEEVWSIKIKE